MAMFSKPNPSFEIQIENRVRPSILRSSIKATTDLLVRTLGAPLSFPFGNGVPESRDWFRSDGPSGIGALRVVRAFKWMPSTVRRTKPNFSWFDPQAIAAAFKILPALALSAHTIFSSSLGATNRFQNPLLFQTGATTSHPSVRIVRTLPEEVIFDRHTNIVITTDEGSTKLWDVGTWKLILTLNVEDKQTTSAFLASDGRFVVTTGQDKNKKNVVTRIWDASTGRQLGMLAGCAIFIGSRSLGSPPTAITVGDRTLKFWDASTGQLMKTITAYTKVHSNLDFYLDSLISSNGKYIVPFSGKSLPLWNTDTGALIAELKPIPEQLFRGRTLEIDFALR